MARPITVGRIARNLYAAARHYATNQNIDPAHLAFLPMRDTKNNYLYMRIGIDLPVDTREWSLGIKQQYTQDFASGTPFNLVVWPVDNLDDTYRNVSFDEELELVDLPELDG